MQCPNSKCGATVDEGAHVCPQCWANLGTTAPPGPGSTAQEPRKRPSRKLANMSLVLAILSCPLLWFVAASVLGSPIRISLANQSAIVSVMAAAALVMVIAGLAAVVAGGIALARGARASRDGRVIWRPLAGVLIGGISAAFTIWVALSVIHRGRMNADLVVCQNNLRQIEEALKRYADEHVGKYPALPSKSGVLMFTPDWVPPETDLGPRLTCPNIRNAEKPATGSASPFDDQSYFYLGYALRSDEAVEAFAKAYRKRIAEGGNFDEDLVVEDSEGKHVIHRLAQGVDEVLRKEHDRLSLSPYEGKGAGYQEMEPLTVCDDVPIMIERDLGHVCFDCADGAPRVAHVLFLNSGLRDVARGTWPITEKTQRILAELAE